MNWWTNLRVSNNCFVPISVGGSIEKLSHADLYFKNGADKIILGTSSIQNNGIISQIAKKYGSQSIIQSIDVKKNKNKLKFEGMLQLHDLVKAGLK